MRFPHVIAASLAAMVTLGGVTAASAQYYSNDIIADCTHSVGQMKFEGWPADRNREMMMLACEQNGGIIPGTPQVQSPAALQHGAAPRVR